MFIFPISDRGSHSYLSPTKSIKFRIKILLSIKTSWSLVGTSLFDLLVGWSFFYLTLAIIRFHIKLFYPIVAPTKLIMCKIKAIERVMQYCGSNTVKNLRSMLHNFFLFQITTQLPTDNRL